MELIIEECTEVTGEMFNQLKTRNNNMKELKLSDIRKEFKFSMNRGLCDFAIGQAERYAKIIDYDVFLPSKNMNLQRPFCWSLFQKQQLIMSVLKDIIIPKMTFVKHEKTLQVIDGKQRLNALFGFVLGEFPIIHNGNEYYFNELDKHAKMRITTFRPISDIGYSYDDDPISDEDKIAWFEQINFLGTPQDIEHMSRLKQ